MKRIVLAAVASAALCLPALAQQNQQSGQLGQTPQATQQSQSNPGATASQTGGGTQEISANRLNSGQVREIQQALDNKGFKSGRVDGRWGPETETAFKDFQKSQNMPANGLIDSKSLAALGLNASDFGINVGTTGQAPSSTSGQAPDTGRLNAAPPRQSTSGQVTPPKQHQ